MKRILLASFLGLFFLGNAQQREWSCGFDQAQEPYQKTNKEIDDMIYNMRKKIVDANKTGKPSPVAKTVNGIYEIPIVVHVIAPTGATIGSQYNKSDAQIQTWVDNVNAMYAGTYNWSQGVPADFGVAASLPIRLVLAKRDPNCNATNGIIRYNGGTLTGYDAYGVKRNGTNGVTTAQIKSIAPHWPESTYFNIYIMNKVDGGGTYGIMGWCGLPTNPDSAYESFMKSFVVDLQDDITLAHEFGHGMGLLHTFGNANASPPNGTTSTTYCPAQTYNDCARDDDGVCDTERSRSMLNDFPTPNNTAINQCTGTNYQGVQYNMMNYTNPTAFKFTNGQADRAALYFFGFRGALTTSLGGVAPAPVTSIGAPIAACQPTGITNAVNSLVGPILVKLGNINNGSSGFWQYGAEYYVDYTGVNCSQKTQTELPILGSHALTVKYIDEGNDLRVWIDFNNNGTFETSELVASANNMPADPNNLIGTFTGNFTAPASTVLNTPLRMRVLVDYQNLSMSPCGNLNYGQMEDYTVKFVTNLGTSEVSADKDAFAVYPNPAKEGEGFFIKTKDGKNLSVVVSDISGRMIGKPSVTKTNGDSYKVNQQLSTGVYMIQVSNGKETKTSKLIVK